MKKLFMIEFELPETFTEEFIARIPQQRVVVNQLLARRTLQSYTLALDRSRLWVVMEAGSEFEVMETLARFPLSDFMTPHISELLFHQSSEMIHQFSLN